MLAANVFHWWLGIILTVAGANYVGMLSTAGVVIRTIGFIVMTPIGALFVWKAVQEFINGYRH